MIAPPPPRRAPELCDNKSYHTHLILSAGLWLLLDIPLVSTRGHLVALLHLQLVAPLLTEAVKLSLDVMWTKHGLNVIFLLFSKGNYPIVIVLKYNKSTNHCKGNLRQKGLATQGNFAGKDFWPVQKYMQVFV